MSLLAHVGISEGEDSYVVGANACQSAVNGLGSNPANLLIVFASTQYDQEKMLRGARSVAPSALLVGCSTAGEITEQGPAQRHSVVVMAIYSPEVKFFAGVGDTFQGATQAGREAAKKVKEAFGDELKSFIMFPDILTGNGADMVRGAIEVLGEHFPLVGGAAGDDFHFKKTFQYLNDTVYSGSVVGLGMAGNVKMGIGVKHGWMPIGMSMTATKAEGSVLHELDGKPAINIYKDYFGETETKELYEQSLAQLAITYPLGLQIAGSDEMLIRDALSVDENGSITCAAEVPENSTVQLMVGSREEAVAVAKVAAENAVAQLGGTPPKAVIIFNCIARNKLFGDRAGEEIAAIQEVVGRDTPLIGFYTYGEQAPLNGEVKNIEKCNSVFHNETVVICALT